MEGEFKKSEKTERTVVDLKRNWEEIAEKFSNLIQQWDNDVQVINPRAIYSHLCLCRFLALLFLFILTTQILEDRDKIILIQIEDKS